MGCHVAVECPELDRLVDDTCAAIGREVEALTVPRLAGVVLGGGYGRGEGGCRIADCGSSSACRSSSVEWRLYNDLDFFAITDDGASSAEIAAIVAALEPVSKKWTAKIGIDVDFTVRTPWRIKHDEERLMIQELVRGYFDITGKRGEELFAGIRRIDASKVPWMEAARLLMNRGMGLLLAKCKVESVMCKVGEDFVNRNINKCVLGVGDAFLVSRGLYRWHVEERATVLAEQGDDGLYARAVEWKFRPSEEPVCDWERARETWLDGYTEVLAAVGDSDYSRTLRNAARWLVRRRSIGELRTFALDPVIRVLERVARCVRGRIAPSASLMRDWRVFN